MYGILHAMGLWKEPDDVSLSPSPQGCLDVGLAIRCLARAAAAGACVSPVHIGLATFVLSTEGDALELIICQKQINNGTFPRAKECHGILACSRDELTKEALPQ